VLYSYREEKKKLSDRFTPDSWRISKQAWLGLLALVLVSYFTITHTRLILEIAADIFGAILISLAFHPLHSFLAKKGIPRSIGVGISYILILGVLALLGDLLVPLFSTEIDLFKTKGPDFLNSISDFISSVPILHNLIPSTNNLSQIFTQRLDTLVQTTFATLINIGTLLVDAVIVLILVYFFSTDPGIAKRIIRKWTPDHLQDTILIVAENVRQRLTRWVNAQMFFVLYFTATYSITMALFKIPFAFAIGLLGGLFGIIHYVGAYIATILAILVALTVKPIYALWIFLIFAAINEVQGHILAPAIYGRATKINTALALLALFVGAELAGIVGAFFAIPVTVVLTAIVSELQTIQSSNGESQPEVDDQRTNG
jgi:predicted PurR-regulated permease PerM